jgi:hypothetical protein
MEYKSIVDNVWKCGCGGMNSPYNNYCGKCKMTKDETNKDTFRE